MPTECLPHIFSWGASTPQEIEQMDRAYDEPDSMGDVGMDDMGRRGQILWIRGLTRLQHQVSILFCRVVYYPGSWACKSATVLDSLTHTLTNQHKPNLLYIAIYILYNGTIW